MAEPEPATTPPAPSPQPPDQPPEQPPGTSAGRRGARGRRRWGSYVARGVLALLFLLGAYLSLVPQGRATARASLLLVSFITASQPAPLVLNGDPVTYTSQTITSAAGPVYLDVYAPATPTPLIPGAREGLLVIPGVGDERREAQLINFSKSVARAGLVVMDLTTDTLISNTLAPGDSDAVVAAYQTLAHWPGVSPTRITILGFSAGNALAVRAAADPRIRDSVASVVSFGGYFDANSLLTDVGQRGQLVDGHFQSWNPNPLPLQVLANTLAPTLPPNEGQELADAFALNGTPLTPTQVTSLSPPGAAAYHLLTGDQPGRAQANVAALSPEMHDLLAELSPSTMLGSVRAPIYLFHDQTDPYVPFTQSRAFAAALTQLGHPHEYAELTIFAHTEVKSGLGVGPVLRDGSALFRVLVGLLQPAS